MSHRAEFLLTVVIKHGVGASTSHIYKLLAISHLAKFISLSPWRVGSLKRIEGLLFEKSFDLELLAYKPSSL
jgi:hypothetical protein